MVASTNVGGFDGRLGGKWHTDHAIENFDEHVKGLMSKTSGEMPAHVMGEMKPYIELLHERMASGRMLCNEAKSRITDLFLAITEGKENAKRVHAMSMLIEQEVRYLNGL